MNRIDVNHPVFLLGPSPPFSRQHCGPFGCALRRLRYFLRKSARRFASPLAPPGEQPRKPSALRSPGVPAGMGAKDNMKTNITSTSPDGSSNPVSGASCAALIEPAAEQIQTDISTLGSIRFELVDNESAIVRDMLSSAVRYKSSELRLDLDDKLWFATQALCQEFIEHLEDYARGHFSRGFTESADSAEQLWEKLTGGQAGRP